MREILSGNVHSLDGIEKERITSSNFGAVKRRESYLCEALVRNCSTHFKGTSILTTVWYQKAQLSRKYVLHMASSGVNVKVHRKGLAIHPVCPHIAASTDRGRYFWSGWTRSATSQDCAEEEALVISRCNL